MHWATEACMPFWTKKRETGIWDFKGKAGDSQVEGKEQTRGKQTLAGPLETVGHRGGSGKEIGWNTPCLPHFVQMC